MSEKLIVKAMKAPVGDYRDWAAIEARARKITEALEKGEYDGNNS